MKPTLLGLVGALSAPGALGASNFASRTGGAVFTVDFAAADCAGASFASESGQTDFWPAAFRDEATTSCPTDGNGVVVVAGSKASPAIFTDATDADLAALWNDGFTIEAWVEPDVSAVAADDEDLVFGLGADCGDGSGARYTVDVRADSAGDCTHDFAAADVCGAAPTTELSEIPFDAAEPSLLYVAIWARADNGYWRSRYKDSATATATATGGFRQSSGGVNPLTNGSALAMMGELLSGRVYHLSVYDEPLDTAEFDANANAFLPNSPPYPVASTGTTAEDVPGPVTVTCRDFDVDHQAWNVDFDAATDTPTAVISALPALGTLFDHDSGAEITAGDLPYALSNLTVSYQGGPDGYGSNYDSFEFECQDQEATSVFAATATVTVTPVNDPPVAVSQAQSMSIGANAPLFLAGRDPESGSTTGIAGGSITRLPENGVLSWNNSVVTAEQLPFPVPQDTAFLDRPTIYYNYTGPTDGFDSAATHLTNDSFWFTVFDPEGLESLAEGKMTVLVDNSLEPQPDDNLVLLATEDSVSELVIEGTDNSGAGQSFSFVVEEAPLVGTLYLDAAGTQAFAYPQTIEMGATYGQASIYYLAPADYFNTRGTTTEYDDDSACGPGAGDGNSFPLKLVGSSGVQSESKTIFLLVQNQFDPISLVWDGEDITVGDLQVASPWAVGVSSPDGDCFDFQVRIQCFEGVYSYSTAGLGFIYAPPLQYPSGFLMSDSSYLGNETGFNFALGQMTYTPAAEGTDTLLFTLSRPEDASATTETAVGVDVTGTYFQTDDDLDDGDDSPLGFTIDWKIGLAVFAAVNCCLVALCIKMGKRILRLVCCCFFRNGGGGGAGSAKLDEDPMQDQQVELGQVQVRITSSQSVVSETPNPLAAAKPQPPPPPGKPPAEAVPPPADTWETFQTETGQSYYFNKHTRRTTWTDPLGPSAS